MKKRPADEKKCQACEGFERPLSAQDVQKHLDQSPEWQLNADGKKIFRKYVLKNFLSAIRFINGIAQLAEEQNHHPDIHLTDYCHVRVDLSTHAVDGLTANDFILAQQINQLCPELKS